MGTLDNKSLRQTTQVRLQAASYDPRKLMLLHTGASLGISFLITLLNFVLTRQIDTTGGLSGLQTRTILETVQSVLQLAGSVALPFWEIGILYAVIRIARGQESRPVSLLEGFRRFGPVLRLMLIQSVLFFVIALVCIYLSTGVYMMTPLAQPLLEIMLPLMEDSSALSQGLVLDDATMTAMLEHMWPVFVIFGMLFLLAVIPLLFRFRMAEYLLMDDEKGAIAAMVRSWKMTKGHVLPLIKLDLSFWWFYALQLLSAVLSYGDVLLPMVGIELPFSADAAFFGFYLAHILFQLGLYWWAGSRKYTTYALAYDTLRQAPAVPVAPPVPKNQPWDY